MPGGRPDRDGQRLRDEADENAWCIERWVPHEQVADTLAVGSPLTGGWRAVWAPTDFAGHGDAAPSRCDGRHRVRDGRGDRCRITRSAGNAAGEPRPPSRPDPDVPRDRRAAQDGAVRARRQPNSGWPLRTKDDSPCHVSESTAAMERRVSRASSGRWACPRRPSPARPDDRPSGGQRPANASPRRRGAGAWRTPGGSGRPFRRTACSGIAEAFRRRPRSRPPSASTRTRPS